MKKPNIHRLIELQKLLLQFRAIERIIYVPGSKDKQENDTEHSYDLAIAAWFLVQYFPELDRNKVIRLAMVHDLVEIYAGDTFAYSKKDKLANKREREAVAAAKLAEEWPDFPELTKAIAEYEARQSAEAKFVYALDKIMPALMGVLGEGHFWHKHGITLEDFRNEKERKVKESPELLPYYYELYELIKSRSELMPSSSQQR